MLYKQHLHPQDCIGIGARHSICPSLVTVDVSALLQKAVKAGVSGVGQMRKGTAIQSLTPMRDNNIKTKNEKENRR